MNSSKENILKLSIRSRGLIVDEILDLTQEKSLFNFSRGDLNRAGRVHQTTVVSFRQELLREKEVEEGIFDMLARFDTFFQDCAKLDKNIEFVLTLIAYIETYNDFPVFHLTPALLSKLATMKIDFAVEVYPI